MLAVSCRRARGDSRVRSTGKCAGTIGYPHRQAPHIEALKAEPHETLDLVVGVLALLADHQDRWPRDSYGGSALKALFRSRCLRPSRFPLDFGPRGPSARLEVRGPCPPTAPFYCAAENSSGIILKPPTEPKIGETNHESVHGSVLSASRPATVGPKQAPEQVCCRGRGHNTRIVLHLVLQAACLPHLRKSLTRAAGLVNKSFRAGTPAIRDDPYRACPARLSVASRCMGKFGRAPRTEDQILRAFFGDQPFVRTGPERWNALGLGSTAMFARPLVYSRRHEGTFLQFELRIEDFPDDPPAEWFVVDLLNHADEAGASRTDLAAALVQALAHGTFDRGWLFEMAETYGSRSTWAIVQAAIQAAEDTGTSLG